MTLASQPGQDPTRRPPMVRGVVTDLDFARPIDWSSWYLTEEEDMGQGPDHDEVTVLFAEVLTARVAELGLDDVYVGRDVFFGWIEGEPLVQVSPDIYTLSPPPARPLPASFQTWRPGLSPPGLAVEIVSDDWAKDYRDNPPKYAMLGVTELIIFDPVAAAGATRVAERVAIQVWRRMPDGNFLRVYQSGDGAGPAYCETARAWLAIEPVPGSARLRLARDMAGRDLVPTSAEMAAAAIARAENAIARAENAIARAESAEAEVARLRAALREAQRPTEG